MFKSLSTMTPFRQMHKYRILAKHVWMRLCSKAHVLMATLASFARWLPKRLHWVHDQLSIRVAPDNDPALVQGKLPEGPFRATPATLGPSCRSQ